MADIFISYAREDRPKVQRLAEIFEARGLSVWWDMRLQAGEVWDEVIERELAAAHCVVVLWSKASVQKRWVRAEANEGLKRQILIPTCIDNVNLPIVFQLVQWKDLTSWSGEPLNLSLISLVVAAETKIRHRPNQVTPTIHVPVATPAPAPITEHSKWDEAVLSNTADAYHSYLKTYPQGAYTAEAQCNLGLMYRNGRGVAKDEAQAVQWFRKAADQGKPMPRPTSSLFSQGYS